MAKLYQSPYQAYSFLDDQPEDYRCDFEILTDELASLTGQLRATCAASTFEEHNAIVAELQRVDELIYHLNPSLRTKVTITDSELQWLLERTKAMDQVTKANRSFFVLPAGSVAACQAHVIRSKWKVIVRLLYRMDYAGKTIPPKVYDLCNLFSGYFFMLALYLNKREHVTEIPFESRNYKIKK